MSLKRSEREGVELLLVLRGHPGEYHGDLETRMPIARTRNNDAIVDIRSCCYAGEILTLFGLQIHCHFRPNRDVRGGAKLDSILAEENLICSKIQQGVILGSLVGRREDL